MLISTSLILFAAVLSQEAGPRSPEMTLLAHADHKLTGAGFCACPCDGSYDFNPYHEYSLSLNWSLVEGASSYWLHCTPGCGTTIFGSGSTGTSLFWSAGLDHVYTCTGGCIRLPLFVPGLLNTLDGQDGLTYFVEAKDSSGQVLCTSNEFRMNTRPGGCVFLIPGICLSGGCKSPTYAHTQLDALAAALDGSPWMGAFAPTLDHDLFIVDNFDAAGTQKEKALALQRFIEQKIESGACSGDEIQLVGYSEGGRVALAYMNLPGAREVSMYRSIASPHMGSPVADLGFVTGIAPLVALFSSTSVRQLWELATPASRWNTRKWSGKLPSNSLTLFGEFDTIVPVARAKLQQTPSQEVLLADHGSIVDSESLSRQLGTLFALPVMGPEDVRPNWDDSRELYCPLPPRIGTGGSIGSLFTSEMWPGGQSTAPSLGKVAPLHTATQVLQVDGGSRAKFFILTWDKQASVELVDPSGTVVDQLVVSGFGEMEVVNPQPGAWSVQVTNPSSSEHVGVVAGASITGVTSVVGYTDKLVYSPGELAILEVLLDPHQTELSSVSAETRLFTLAKPDVPEIRGRLLDDGVSPDAREGDGIFTAAVVLPEVAGAFGLGTTVSGVTAQGHEFTRSLMGWIEVEHASVARENLLLNPGAETGTTANWTAIPSFEVRSQSPLPHSGSFSFYAGNQSSHTFEQSVDLLSVGFTPAQLDAGEFVAIAGGWRRAANEAPPDVGHVEAEFLNAGGVSLGAVQALAPGSSEQLTWSRFAASGLLPVGTRSITFRLIASQQTGPTNDVSLDDAFLFVTNQRERQFSPPR